MRRQSTNVSRETFSDAARRLRQLRADHVRVGDIVLLRASTYDVMRLQLHSFRDQARATKHYKTIGDTHHDARAKG